MKSLPKILTVSLLLSSSWLLAQDIGEDGAATWSPAEPDPGDSLTIWYDVSKGTLTGNEEPIILHWGINAPVPGAWQQAPEVMWPPNSEPWPDNKAAQTPMNKINDNMWELTFMTLDTIRSVHWVFTDGSSWDNNGAADWNLPFGDDGGGPEHADTVSVTFLADLSNAVANRGFVLGDTLVAKAGYFQTASQVYEIPMVRQGFSSFYQGTGEIVTTVGEVLDYQYFTTQKGIEYREIYYNFEYDGEVQSEAERRQIPVLSAEFTVADTVASNLEQRRMPFFRNVNVVAQDVVVTLTLDMRPAIYTLLRTDQVLEDIQGNVTIDHPDSVLAKGVAVNGPITGSWSNDIGADWGPHLMDLEEKRMWDDGTNGDVVAGDSIFTKQFMFYTDSADVVGQEFKFGIGGGDNEGGYGNNHIANIDDQRVQSTINAQFGSIDPIFYYVWDYDERGPATSVSSQPPQRPLMFALEQNYPNPFNPATQIRYSLARSVDVTLTVYNAMGQEVVTLVQEKQPAGYYQVTWDGLDAFGRQVSSGLYFYQIQAGRYIESQKMMLLR